MSTAFSPRTLKMGLIFEGRLNPRDNMKEKEMHLVYETV